MGSFSRTNWQVYNRRPPWDLIGRTVQLAAPILAAYGANYLPGPGDLGNAGMAVGRALKRKWAGAFTQTEKKQKYAKKGQTTYGRYAGAVRKYYRARSRRYRRGKRMVRKTRRAVKLLNKGVSIQREASASVSDDRCIFINSSTACLNDHLQLMVMILFKKVLAHGGQFIDDFQSVRAGYIATGDQFLMVYKPTTNATATATGMTYTVVAGDTTFRQIVTNIATQFVTGIAAATFNNGMIPLEFQWVKSGGEVVRIQIQDCVFHFYSSAVLTIQNRSIAASGDDEMDVNNVPLQGRVFRGVGNRPVFKSRDNTNFECNATTGVVAGGVGTIVNLQEPPDPSEFIGVKQYAPLKIQPGHIKKTYISFKTNIKIGNLMSKFIDILQGASIPLYDLGGHRLIFLERMISKLSTETNGVLVTYQQETKHYCTMHYQSKSTLPIKSVE